MEIYDVMSVKDYQSQSVKTKNELILTAIFPRSVGENNQPDSKIIATR